MKAIIIISTLAGILCLIWFVFAQYKARRARRDWEAAKQAMRRFPDNDDIPLRKQ